MSYDQFDNARRLVRLGVAKEISRRAFRGAAVAATLSPLLESSEVAARCQALAARCDGPAALHAACDALEELTGGAVDNRVGPERSTTTILE
jgi:UDP:flavonoid glycosyltransferase YjiC (YdhE family)